jgi:transmembrane sensor
MSAWDREPPLSEEERFWVLLDSYLAGDARSADVNIVREWLSADPKRAELVEDFRRIREVATAGKKHRSAEEAWRRLLPALQLEVSGPPRSREGLVNPRLRLDDSSRSNHHLRARWRFSAAVVLAAIGVSSVVTSSLDSRRSAAPPRMPSDSVRSFSTSRGQRAEIRLADGSRVSLAPQSRLVVLPSGDHARDVHLDGEAYFDVVHDERRPFTVRVRNTIVRDVGTRFAVRAYAIDTLVQVVVTQGHVRVRPDSAAESSGTLLDPRMVARVSSAGAISVQATADTSRYLGFTKGQIVFVGRPLRDVVRELERWYDIKIRLADPKMGDRRITATIADQTLPDLLAQLSIALNVRASRTGQFIVLSDRPKPKRPAF